MKESESGLELEATASVLEIAASTAIASDLEAVVGKASDFEAFAKKNLRSLWEPRNSFIGENFSPRPFCIDPTRRFSGLNLIRLQFWVH